MIVSEILKHLKKYRFINIIFLIVFVFICISSYISKKDNLVSQTNIYARSDLFYSEIVNQNKKLIYEGSNDQSIDVQYADTLRHINEILNQGDSVKGFESMMKSIKLVPLFLSYLRDRAEFDYFLENNPIAFQLIDRIGQDLSQKFKDQKISIYEVFYNKILKIKSDKHYIKLNFNGKSSDDILKLQNLFTEFFLNNFDDRLQEIVLSKNNNNNLKINNKALFYKESSKFTSPLIFEYTSFIVLSFLIYLFLIISINFFLYFFKK